MAKTAAKAPKKVGKSPKKIFSGVETNLVRKVTMKPTRKEIPNFRAGDTLNVFVKVREGEKERVQLYKGIVTKIQGSGVAKSFTVRKISAGVGVERTFPFLSPAVDRVEVVNLGKVRRAKLYYLRGLEGKAAKVESELAGTSSEQTAADTAKASGSAN